jgi:hypothetical protein
LLRKEKRNDALLFHPQEEGRGFFEAGRLRGDSLEFPLGTAKVFFGIV